MSGADRQNDRNTAVSTENDEPVGYGYLEQQGNDPASHYIYVLCSPSNIQSEVGSTLYARLLQDAKALGVRQLWARELQEDTPSCSFFAQQGFIETRRWTPPNYAPVMVLQLSL